MEDRGQEDNQSFDLPKGRKVMETTEEKIREQTIKALIYQIGCICRSPMEKEELIKEYLELQEAA